MHAHYKTTTNAKIQTFQITAPANKTHYIYFSFIFIHTYLRTNSVMVHRVRTSYLCLTYKHFLALCGVCVICFAPKIVFITTTTPVRITCCSTFVWIKMKFWEFSRDSLPTSHCRWAFLRHISKPRLPPVFVKKKNPWNEQRKWQLHSIAGKKLINSHFIAKDLIEWHFT